MTSKVISSRGPGGGIAAALLLLISAAYPGEEVHVDRTAEAVVVRSPMDQWNFLFRLPALFAEAAPAEGFQVDLTATGGSGGSARIRLRLSPLPGGETRDPIETIARAREKAYIVAPEPPPVYTPAANRCLVASRTPKGQRTVLVVVDGQRLYELFLDGGGEFEDDLQRVADGFTLLDPKGRPEVPKESAGEQAEKLLEHDYYRLKLLKPQGFALMEVDPNRDPGIWVHLRRADPARGACDIRVKIHLSKALAESCVAKAEKALADMRTKYTDVRAPARPLKFATAASKEGYVIKVTGKLPAGGIVAAEEYRVIEHDNGRLYEFQMITLGGAAREFKREIAAFWKALKIIDR